MLSTLWVFVLWICGWGCVEVSGKVSGQLYSSLAHMEALFDFDEQLGDLLLNHLPEHLPAANRYLESYLGAQTDRQLGREVRGHPIHVFQVIKRLVLFWPHIEPTLHLYTKLEEGRCVNLHPECHNWAMIGNCLHFRQYMLINCGRACHVCLPTGLKKRILTVLSEAGNTTMPSENDLRGAALALSRLQVYYRIPINSFMLGNIKGAPCTARLLVEDCVRVAEMTFSLKKYGDAWHWYNYCQASAHMDPKLVEEIKARKEEVEEEHDKNYIAGNIDFLHVPLNKTKNQPPMDTIFRQLCRGVKPTYKDEKEQLRESLQCYVDSRDSPYLTLQPVRYEHIHCDPEMFIFHDVVSDSEIAVIKKLARQKLSRSTLVSTTTPVSEQRVSHTAWLKNQSHPVLERIGHRIAYITKLFAFEDTVGREAAEDLQVLNYGIGGLYDAHYDCLYKWMPEEKWDNEISSNKKLQSGDRIATWMFYLSDVIAGGGTAFPNAGVHVSPKKGSAVFWFNMKKNGYFNFRSQHGGCPVLLGEKWVANRWIKENQNFLRRPCSINEDE